MQTKFKRHQSVRLLRAPLIEDVEPYAEPPVEIKKGMVGKINIILPNGQYHVDILNEKGETIAYCAIDEEGLEEVKDSEPDHSHDEHPENWADKS